MSNCNCHKCKCNRTTFDMWGNSVPVSGYPTGNTHKPKSSLYGYGMGSRVGQYIEYRITASSMEIESKEKKYE